VLLKAAMPETFDRAQKVAVSAGTQSEDEATIAKLHETVTALTPTMMARQMAMVQGKAPAALPNDGGFIRLEDLPQAQAKEVKG